MDNSDTYVETVEHRVDREYHRDYAEPECSRIALLVSLCGSESVGRARMLPAAGSALYLEINQKQE